MTAAQPTEKCTLSEVEGLFLRCNFFLTDWVVPVGINKIMVKTLPFGRGQRGNIGSKRARLMQVIMFG